MIEEKQEEKLCEKVEQSYHLLGKKWIGLILYTLKDEPKRFSEIATYIPNLSKRVLNERIKELEDSGIVIRNVIADRPIRTEYSLTKKGTELTKALTYFENWAEKWL
ncbi:winged helix-turn-helix transcriptional regulator [Peribacillus loiseleuriae]|uniref:HxlR family transcriptional regulator n=1 Tax=Peribacillus loiseleuriae TaxID=1679170 RepID=A0A0K9GX32_9BACI|nr:helix-turn-helix domain-containing protein [Peribacillus loiseleuriae]KMY50822.1 HxlR family transcriptional regulator [Peribacillus loiseleuriae]